MLGRKIRELRQDRNMTLRQLAIEADISSFSYIANIERGVVKDPAFSTVVKLADALNVSLNELR